MSIRLSFSFPPDGYPIGSEMYASTISTKMGKITHALTGVMPIHSKKE
jgi:hypothetical protein